MIDLAKLKQLHEAATPGPWTRLTIAIPDGTGEHMEFPSFGVKYECGETAPTNAQPGLDSDLLCYLRNYAPEILSRLEAADRMAEALEKIRTLDEDVTGDHWNASRALNTDDVREIATKALEYETDQSAGTGQVETNPRDSAGLESRAHNTAVDSDLHQTKGQRAGECHHGHDDENSDCDECTKENNLEALICQLRLTQDELATAHEEIERLRTTDAKLLLSELMLDGEIADNEPSKSRYFLLNPQDIIETGDQYYVSDDGESYWSDCYTSIGLTPEEAQLAIVRRLGPPLSPPSNKQALAAYRKDEPTFESKQNIIGSGLYLTAKPGTFGRSEWLDLLMACQDGRATCMRALEIIEREMDAMLTDPPKHVYWGAGEPDCPKEIKAANGELHTLKCKVCGTVTPKSQVCLAAYRKEVAE